MKKGFALLISLLLVLGLWAGTPALADPEITPHPTLSPSKVEGTLLKDDALNCRSAILVDNTTGSVLYAKDADSKQYPASITKIMTCLLALEYSQNTADGLQEKVKVAPFEPLRKDYSKIGMKEGEVYTLEQLLYGLMLPSGNDAAIAIADHIAGSISAFADMMNVRAQEIGMTGSHFVNPHGIHDPDHYVTARDMMLLTREAMKNQDFRTIVATPTYTCPATNKNDKRKWTNSNRFYGVKYPEFKWEPMIGVKTGYTDAALNTFVGALSYEGREQISVILGSPDSATRFIDTKLLMRYGLRYYDTINLWDIALKQDLTLAIPNAQSKDPVPVILAGSEPVYATLPVADTDALTLDANALTITIRPGENLSAPLAQDTPVGTAEISYKGVTYAEAEVRVRDNVAVDPATLPTEETPATDPAEPGQELPPTDLNSPPAETLAPASPPSNGTGQFRRILLIVIGLLLLLVAVAIVFMQLLPTITGKKRRARHRYTSQAAQRSYNARQGNRGRRR